MTSFADTLLALTSYPEPSPPACIDHAVGLAAAIGAGLSALAFEVEGQPPVRRHFIADRMLDIRGMLAAEREKSAASVRLLLETFARAATQRGVLREQIAEGCLAALVAKTLADHARLRDLTIVPLRDGDDGERACVEAVIFGSGRPVVVLPDPARYGRAPAIDQVTVAWDYSRPAARAVGDALPILKRAKRVRALIVTKEKAIETAQPHTRLVQHLEQHGISAALDVVDAAGRSIGAVLEADVAANGTDLLVMGAYGHSRVRDFVLGGATKSMLLKPPVPLFLSH